MILLRGGDFSGVRHDIHSRAMCGWGMALQSVRILPRVMKTGGGIDGAE